jgi:hypothetical protein
MPLGILDYLNQLCSCEEKRQSGNRMRASRRVGAMNYPADVRGRDTSLLKPCANLTERVYREPPQR